METNRNLLFAIFAVQLKGVHPSQIVETGTADAGGALGERLVASGALSSSGRAMLERLVDEAIAAHDGDALKTLETFGSREKARRMFLGEVASSDLEGMATVPMSQVSFLDETGELAPTMEESPGRYSQISQYARGGMGRVLLVHDEHIGRNVALKELLPLHETSESGDPISPVQKTASLTARFLHEARITGQLEHPSIVPVYELGRRQDGRLYYTMKLVKGQTLAHAIRECNSLDERLQLLQHFVALCQAIAYAHSRGVIHRDIKPANVMAGEFGETVVLDWGLAKRQGMDDPHLAEARRTRDRFDASGGSLVPKTSYGKALGTPNYMPPEQAEGRLEAVDERSDVYSLGAVLYEMLSGQPPFSGNSVQQIIEDVVNEPLRPLADLEPDTPPELVGICEKCLRKDPEARYDSAQAVADEIQRFTSGALVRSYRYSVAEILRHTYRKHRAAVHTGLVAVFILLAFAVYSFIRISRALDREYAQRLVAEDARSEAVAARDVAEYESYVAGVRLAEMYLEAGHTCLALATLWKTDEGHRNWEWGYLLNACNQPLFTIPERSASMGVADFSPCGRYVGTLHYAKPLKIWDATSGAPVAVTEDAGSRPLAFAFSPDGNRVAGACQDATVRIWESQSGELLMALEGHEKAAKDVAFSRDGARLVTTSDDGTIRLWDAQDGSPLTVMRYPSGRGALVEFAESDSRVLTVTAENSCTIWNTDDGSAAFSVDGCMACLNPGGTMLAALQDEGCLVWNSANGEIIEALGQHDGGASCLAFSQQGDLLLTGCEDGEAILWSLAPPQKLMTFDHGQRLKCVAFLQSDSLVLTCARDGTKVWERETGRQLASLTGMEGSILSVAVSQADEKLVAGFCTGAFKVWDIAEVLRESIATKHTNEVQDVAFHGATDRLASVAWDNTVRIADGAPGLENLCLHVPSPWSHEAVAFSPGGERIAAVQDPFTPILWNPANPGDFTLLVGHGAGVTDIAFSPGGDRVVTASQDMTAKVWDAASGEELLSLAGHGSVVSSAAYSADGLRIVTASNDGSAIIWDALSGEEAVKLAGNGGPVFAAAFTPSGRHVVTGGQGRTAVVWDAERGTVCHTLAGHTAAVFDVAVTPDGSRIVTFSGDGTAKVWDARTGEQLTTLKGGHGVISAGDINATGMEVASAWADGLVRTWRAAPWRLAQLPGEEGQSWEDRYQLYQESKNRNTTRQGDGENHQVPPHILLTTRETFAARLRRLRTALVSEDSQPVSGQVGTACTPGRPHDALAWMCLTPGCRISQLGDVEITSRSSALRALDQTLAGLKGQGTVSARIMQGSESIPLQIRLLDPVSLEKKVTLPRNVALEVLQWELDSLERNRDVILEVSQRHTDQMGDPSDSPCEINGQWVPGPSSGLERELYLQLGIASGDRIVRLNGKPVRSLEQMKHDYETAQAALKARQGVTLDIEVERGLFQRLHLAIEAR